jgi:hypothetical protein
VDFQQEAEGCRRVGLAVLMDGELMAVAFAVATVAEGRLVVALLSQAHCWCQCLKPTQDDTEDTRVAADRTPAER